MSMPNIPDINPDICLCLDDVINLLLSSVALQEIALSNVINAESEKLHSVLKKKEHCYSVDELVCLNESIEKVLYVVSTIETLLVTKLKYINQLCVKKDNCKVCKSCDECCDDKSKFDFASICNKYIEEFNCKNKKDCGCDNDYENDYEDNCDCDCEYDNKFKDNNKVQNNEVKTIKTNNKNKSEQYINNQYKTVSGDFNGINNSTYSKNSYYQNYNRITDMFNKILGRGVTK